MPFGLENTWLGVAAAPPSGTLTLIIPCHPLNILSIPPDLVRPPDEVMVIARGTVPRATDGHHGPLIIHTSIAPLSDPAYFALLYLYALHPHS